MYFKNSYHNGKVVAEVSLFAKGSDVAEYNVIFHITDSSLTFSEQLSFIQDSLDEFMMSVSGLSLAFRRYFLSDASNQQASVAASASKQGGAVSLVQQPPLDGTKVALWALAMTGVKTSQKDLFSVVEHGKYKHYWAGNMSVAEGDSFHQTNVIMRDYANQLEKNGMKMQNDCIRTWFFVQNVDVNYQGVVDARRELFYDYDLNKDTHYIASTGIDGRDGDKKVLAKMDAYAVSGLDKKQISFLYAKDYLNPTYEYNVTFERGVTVSYSDRKHLFLSGTASIDNKGNVLYPGDIRRQTERMWLNSEKLLEEGGASLDKSVVMIVYLRDVADYAVVKAKYQERFPDIPKVILLAPVCRPGWLIEMETVAAVELSDAAMPEF